MAKGIERAVTGLSFAGDGSFGANMMWAPSGAIAEIVAAAGWGVAVDHVRGESWTSGSIALVRNALRDVTGAEVRRARSLANGGVEATLERRSVGGRVTQRTLRIAASGSWTSRYAATLSDGSKVTGTASQRGRGRPVRFERAKVSAEGAAEWTLKGESREIQGDSGKATRTDASATYADGSTATYKAVSYKVDKILVKQIGVSRQSTNPIGSHNVGGGKVPKPGLSMSSEVTVWGSDGKIVSGSQTHAPMPGNQGPGSTSRTTDYFSIISHDDGSLSASKGKIIIENPEPSSQGGTTVIETSTEKTGPSGNSSEHSVEVNNHDNGTKSKTESIVGTDGSVTIITRTTDSNGNGQVHQTTYDKNGNQTSDTTTPVTSGQPTGSSGGSGSGSSGSGSGGGSGSSGSGGGSGGDDDDGGGDEGMDWEGGSEGPPDIMPKKPASIWDVLADPTRGLDTDDDDTVGKRIGAALGRGGGIPTGDVRDLGFGEGGGGESLPELILTPASAFSSAPAYPPTDDWGEWNDPRVNVGYAARVVEGLIRAPGADLGALTRANAVLADLASRIAEVQRGRDR